MLNAAARVISGTRKFDRGLHQLLHDELHWLDVSDRVFFNPSVAMVFFKTYVAIGGGVNDPPGVSRVLCHLELKFQRLYPCFRG